MANKNDLFDFDETTASNNDNVQGANIAENCAPSGINNAIRGLCSIVKRALGSQGSAIASAATTAIGAAGTALYTTVTGTTTITGLGTVAAGTFRIIEFTGVLTLTHNSTSLKLPGSANIATAAGDVGMFISLGSGNWKCLHYSRADGTAIAGAFTGTLTSTDAGAGDGPVINLNRDSASPAANDELGQINFNGRDAGGNLTGYGFVDCILLDPTDGSEDGNVRLVALVAGTPTAVVQAANGVQIGSPTGGFKGTGTLNAQTGLYVAGNGVRGALLHVRDEKAAGTNGGGLTSGSFATRTLNTEVTDEIGSTLSSNQFTLPAGTYDIEWRCPGNGVDEFISKLRNVTDSTDTIIGSVAYSGSSAAAIPQTTSFGFGRFTIAGTKTFAIQQRVTTTNGTDGGGKGPSFGVVNVFTDVRVWKVGA